MCDIQVNLLITKQICFIIWREWKTVDLLEESVIIYVKQGKGVTIQDGKFNSEDTSVHVFLSSTHINNINFMNVSFSK
jgi:hypothetical protein